jgi:glycosyltransferase involved in cell wall biosynthesis
VILEKNEILMLGPDINGRGGISNVIRIWKDSSIFSSYNINFVPTISYFKKNTFVSNFPNYCKILLHIFLNTRVVYVHTALYKSLYRKLPFLFFSFLLKKNTILHIHPSTVKRYFSRLNKVERLIINYVFKRIDVIVVLVEEAKKYVKNRFPTKKIHILKNSIIVEKMKNKFDIKRNTCEVLYLGWYVRAKGIYSLVDAIEILVKKGIKIQLKCYGTKNIEKLKNYVKKKSLEEYIAVNDWIGEEEKIKALYRSTLLILPSFSEGIPNVILEAMATKTPIITTKVGGIKEILEDEYSAIFIKAGDPYDMSTKIQRLLKDNKLRERITKNAYFQVKNKYDAKIIKEQFAKILYSNFDIRYKNQNEPMI